MSFGDVWQFEDERGKLLVMEIGPSVKYPDAPDAIVLSNRQPTDYEVGLINQWSMWHDPTAWEKVG